MEDKGYIHIYTGNGKGKTTAALGLALRAAGAGKKVFILQIMKEYPYSEIKALKKLGDAIVVKQVCGDDWVYRKELPPEDEKMKLNSALNSVIESMKKKEFDVYILDEACVAVYFKLLDLNYLLEVIESKPLEAELILTGRYCPDELIETADLVTEMKEVKHYYTQGVLSRKGIDS